MGSASPQCLYSYAIVHRAAYYLQAVFVFVVVEFLVALYREAKLIHYHEWLKIKFVEENTCQKCGQRFFPGSGVYVEKTLASAPLRLHFCSERCAHNHYLDALRTEGI